MRAAAWGSSFDCLDQDLTEVRLCLRTYVMTPFSLPLCSYVYCTTSDMSEAGETDDDVDKK